MSSPSLHLVLPVGDGFGWGVVGRGLTLGMRRSWPEGRLRLVPVDPPGPADRGGRLASVRDPWARHLLTDLLEPGSAPVAEEIPAESNAPSARVPGAVLHAVSGPGLRPAGPPLRSRAGEGPTLGYAVFEDVLHPGVAESVKHHFDGLVAPSRWCAERLEEAGVARPPVVLHGIEPRLFHAAQRNKRHLQDRFVIFSGGKAEMRKGQDLVIRAFAAFQQRHPEALLVCSWYNPWPDSLATLAACPGMTDPFAGLRGTGSPKTVPWETVVRRMLQEHGIDEAAAVVLPPMDQGSLAQVYQESDVGLFPNRCEGASNLVLMEYMACGKPVIATDWAGHRDILTPQNSIPLRRLSNWEVRDPSGGVTGRWVQPDLDEMIAALEWAYDHPEELDALGAMAGEDLARRTWHAAARRMSSLLTAG